MISRVSLIRVWVQKYEAGAFEDAQAADLLQEYEAKIAALERMVARLINCSTIVPDGRVALTPPSEGPNGCALA